MKSDVSSDNTLPAYWLHHYPILMDAAAAQGGVEPLVVAEHMAYIAGDYADMMDEEVFSTYIAEFIEDVPAGV